MKHHAPNTTLPTHEVVNQATEFTDVNLYHTDVALKEAIARVGAPWLEERCEALGERAGSQQMQEWGRVANENPPVFKPFDRFGHRIDYVEFHPAYHNLMGEAMKAGLSSAAWNEEQAGHVGFAALSYLFGQAEAGVLCPMTMSYAAVPSLRIQPDVGQQWIDKLLVPEYDGRFLPIEQKKSATFGMAMTEKQGGSDVRANSTRATPIGEAGPGKEYELVGHKWFCSAPMSDGFLTLANAAGGLSCFLVPRWRPDGTRNPFFIQRLKDKVGNKSNASSEIEYNGTWCQLIGEEGAGVRTIIEMVRHTRLACVAGSTSLMRQALAQAVNHTRTREAFGAKLYDQPLMRNVLADLQLEVEAATALTFRVAHAFDRQDEDEREAALARLSVTVAKYFICKRTPAVAYEAMECFGGAGYVEESVMPRIFRESPLNSIWEGSGNVMSLDVLRAMQREPECIEAVVAELSKTLGSHKLLDRCVGELKEELSGTDQIQLRARRISERMALALQASLLIQHSTEAVAEGFIQSRLGNRGALTFGSLPAGVDVDAILARTLPEE